MDIADKYRNVTDQETRAFARGLLHQLKATISYLLEPVNGDDVFGALDGELFQQPLVSPGHDKDPGPSNATKRARNSASTSSEN